MTSTDDKTKLGLTISYSKDVHFFRPKIGSILTPAGRQLLEQYSGIAPEDVEAHIYRIRDQAWEIFPWPCIGGFWFVTLGLALHPSYPSLLDRLRPTSSAATFLDLGTCLGQDLRKLVADGVSPDKLYGSDIFAGFEAIGHELFRDKDRFRARFLTADLFDETADGPLVKTEGTWNVVSIIMFLHIWDWDTQVRACKRILKLLVREKGSMIIGVQSGTTQPGELVLKPPYIAVGEEKSVYRHSKETFLDMWKIVGSDEGLELDVRVEYDDQQALERRAKEEESGERKSFFSGPEQRRLFFTIETL